MIIISRHQLAAQYVGGARRALPRRWTRTGAVVSGLLAMVLGGCNGDAPAPAAPASPTVSTVVAPARNAAAPIRYFFDVSGHSAAEITELLRRAQTTHDELPAAEQDSISIAIVLHGPDVAFFAADNYPQYRELVDLAASLDARGYVDLKACTLSVNRRGFDATQFPSFIEFVPFGPDEIEQLEARGYVRF